MQWKFWEYFRNENKTISEISQKYSNENAIQLRDEMTTQTTNHLSKEQLAVINRFPQIFDTTMDKINKLDKLVDEWKDKSEIWPFVYNLKLLAFMNGSTAFYISNLFRRSFKLNDSRTALLNIYIPAVCLPIFFGTAIHHYFFTLPVSLGEEKCSECESLKAGLAQGVISTLYPLIYSSISSIYFAYYFNTYPIPDTINDKTSRKYLYDIWFKAIKRNRLGLTFAAISNILFAYYLTSKEQKTIQFMYFSLLSKEYNKSKAQTLSKSIYH